MEVFRQVQMFCSLVLKWAAVSHVTAEKLQVQALVPHQLFPLQLERCYA